MLLGMDLIDIMALIAGIAIFMIIFFFMIVFSRLCSLDICIQTNEKGFWTKVIERYIKTNYETHGNVSCELERIAFVACAWHGIQAKYMIRR